MPMTERDDEADDRFVDHCLHEELGGQRPPDLVARIAAASPGQLSSALAKVDAAAAAIRRSRSLVLAAAALLLGSVGAWLAIRSLVPPAKSVAQQAQMLIDDFHRAMPSHPVMLRDAQRRQQVRGPALPVIRQILALHAAHPDETVFGTRIIEFEVYAAELGDGELVRRLQQRAAAGDVGAAAALATARVATSDDPERAEALAELGTYLKQPDLAVNIVRTLPTAALTKDEAARLADVLTDGNLRRMLLNEARLASSNPGQLPGKPLELFGRLVDDQLFTTQSLRGKVVLVCFWASWCKPSLAALDRIRTVAARHPELAVVGVSCDYEASALQDAMAGHGDPQWIQFFDRTRPGWHEFASEHGVRVVPFAMVLDRDGIVREVDCDRDIEGAVQRILGR
jgi:hypothetical protein